MFYDNFNGEAATKNLEDRVPTTGVDWLLFSGVAGSAKVTTAGKVQCLASNKTVYLCDDQGNADHYVQFRAVMFAAQASSYVACRLADGSNYIGWRIYGTGAAGRRLTQVVGGVATDLYTGQAVANEWIKIKCVGTTVTMYTGGTGATPSWTQVYSGSINAALTSTRQGVVVQDNYASDWIDEFTADDLGPQTVTPPTTPSGSTVYAPIVTGGATMVRPPLVASGSAVFAPVISGGITTPLWLSLIPYGEWGTAGSHTLSAIDPALDPTINPNHPAAAPWAGSTGQQSVMGAWGGGAFDSANSVMWVWGGGHSNYAGNEVYSQDLAQDSPVWTLRRKPTGAIGNTGVLNDLQEATGVYFDGRPRSTHTYGNLTIVDGDLLALPNDGIYATGGQNSYAFRFDHTLNDWADWASTPYTKRVVTGWSTTDMTGSSVFVPDRREIWMIPSSFSQYARFNVDTKTLTGSPRYINGSGGGTTASNQAFDDPVRNAVIIFLDSNISYIDKATPDDTNDLSLTLSAAVPANNKIRGWVYDSTNDRYMTWDDATNVFITLKPPTSNWKTDTWTFGTTAPIALTTVPTTRAPSGTWGRHFYSSRFKGIGLVNRTTEPTYFFRLPRPLRLSIPLVSSGSAVFSPIVLRAEVSSSAQRKLKIDSEIRAFYIAPESRFFQVHREIRSVRLTREVRSLRQVNENRTLRITK